MRLTGKNGESAQRDASVATFPWQPKPNVTCSRLMLDQRMHVERARLIHIRCQCRSRCDIAISTKMISNQLNIVTLWWAMPQRNFNWLRPTSTVDQAFPCRTDESEINRKKNPQIFHSFDEHSICLHKFVTRWFLKKRPHATQAHTTHTDWASRRGLINARVCCHVCEHANVSKSLQTCSMSCFRSPSSSFDWHTDYLISDQFVPCWQKIAQFVGCVRCEGLIKQPSNQWSHLLHTK